MKILVLPGDGIGPEITDATLAVLNRANERFKLGLVWQIEEIGLAALKRQGTMMLFEWLAARHKRPEFDQAAKAIEIAIDAALKNPATRTADLGGKLGTRAFATHVAALIG